jgi:hypothetical protein
LRKDISLHKILPVVEYTNNWESEEYFINNDKVTPGNCKSIHIQWPDLSEEDVKVKWKVVSGSYIDMGKIFSFSRKEMFISINYKGSEIDINLKKVLEYVKKDKT